MENYLRIKQDFHGFKAGDIDKIESNLQKAKRIYKPGVKFKSVTIKGKILEVIGTNFKKDYDGISIKSDSIKNSENSAWWVFYKDKWAEVITEKEEDKIPEYVECIKGSGLSNWTTVGNICKVVSYDPSSGGLQIEEYENGIICNIFFGSKCDKNNSTNFKPSTKEAYEKQHQKKTETSLIPDYVYFVKNGCYEYIFKHGGKNYWLGRTDSDGDWYFSKDFSAKYENTVLASPEQKAHLEACITAGSYVIPEKVLPKTTENLLEEAKKRYPVGTKYMSPFDNCQYTVPNNPIYQGENELRHYGDGVNIAIRDGGFLYYKRKWAEIIYTQNPNTDFIFKPFGIYVGEWGKKDKVIFRTHTGILKETCECISSVNYTPSYRKVQECCTGSGISFREANEKEKEWLLKCIDAGKFVKMDSDEPKDMKKNVEMEKVLEIAKKIYPAGTKYSPAHMDRIGLVCTVSDPKRFYISDSYILESTGDSIKNGHYYSEVIYWNGTWAKILDEKESELIEGNWYEVVLKSGGRWIYKYRKDVYKTSCSKHVDLEDGEKGTRNSFIAMDDCIKSLKKANYEEVSKYFPEEKSDKLVSKTKGLNPLEIAHKTHVIGTLIKGHISKKVVGLISTQYGETYLLHNDPNFDGLRASFVDEGQYLFSWKLESVQEGKEYLCDFEIIGKTGEDNKIEIKTTKKKVFDEKEHLSKPINKKLEIKINKINKKTKLKL